MGADKEHPQMKYVFP